MQDLLDVIDAKLGYPAVDRKGERWVLCPYHADRHKGSFSYSAKGFRCFACGEQGGLRKLADQLGIHSNAPIVFRPRPQPVPEKPRAWQQDPNFYQRYLRIPDAARAYYHQRGFTDETIQRYRLGYGTLPASKCLHPRLILPCFEGGKLVALRGRRFLEDDPHDKWLCAGGSKTVLFGADSLRTGATVIVTEAPYSAILARQASPEIAAVAGTAGAATWRDEWTEQIKTSKPSWCLVWYDHDEAGELNGQRVYKTLKAVGLKVQLWHWNRSDPNNCDLADRIAGGRGLPVAASKPMRGTVAL